MSFVIVGSLAFDTIETPLERRERIVGGSGTYCALAASFFTRPKVVGVVGTDFPKGTIGLLRSHRIDIKGVSMRAGKTFHWEGRYGADPNQRTTVRTDLNVFADFKPELPPSYRSADILYLANIDPDLHGPVLAQARKPKLVAMDTIRFWIENKPEAVFRELGRVDVYFANDEEVKLLAGDNNLVRAGKKLLEARPVARRHQERGARGPRLRKGLHLRRPGPAVRRCRRPDRARATASRAGFWDISTRSQRSLPGRSAGRPFTGASSRPSPSRTSASTGS